jgi:hypothetical protein
MELWTGSISKAVVNLYSVSAMAGYVIPTNHSVIATKIMPFIKAVP